MKLTHVDSKRTVEVATRDDAEPYLSQGWVEKSAPASRAAAKKSATKKSASATSDDAPSAA